MLVAACSGGGETEPEAGTTGTSATTTAPPEATTEDGKATQARFTPLNDRERRWVRRYAGWRNTEEAPFYAAMRIRDKWRFILLDTDYDGPVARYTALLRKAAACQRTLERGLGEPPTEKLAPVYELLRSGCALLADSAASDRKAVAAEDAEALDATESDWEEGILRLEKGDEAVEALLLFNRRPPHKRGVTAASRTEPSFADAIGDVVTENQQVRCWSEKDWPTVVRDFSAYHDEPAEIGRLLGFSRLADPLHLAPRVCAWLARLRYGNERPTSGEPLVRMAEAVIVLAHESEHSLGTIDEAVTECRALQRVREAARRLGAPKPYADVLARAAWEDVYPYVPSEYRTDRCYDGGPLDLRRGSSVWP